MKIIQKYWGILGALAVVLIIAVSVAFTQNGVINSGNQKEADLNAQYNSNMAYLSNCLDKSKQAVGAANAQNVALGDIITKAVTGRYVIGSSATAAVQPGTKSLFSAVQEAYPDTSQIGQIYQQVLTVVIGCRDDYTNYQVKLQSMIADFQKWRTGSFTVRQFGGGFPNNNLVASGQTSGLALIKMTTILAVNAAIQAYDSGQMPDQNLFGSSASPATSR